MKKKAVNEDSDEFDADEPEEFDESGSDWAPEEDATNKKRKGRPKATPKKAAATKKKKVAKKPEPPSEEEDEEEEEEEDEEGEDSEESDSESAGAGPGAKERSAVKYKPFLAGSFVVFKADFKEGSDHPLWKIDGKALLQKFVPFEKDGKKLYKSTSTYSGWTQNNRDQYAAAPVTFIVQGKKETVIEFLRDQVDLEAKMPEHEGKAKAKA